MIPEIFTCPNPYWDAAGYQKAIAQLQQDSLWAYDQAWLGPEKWVEDPTSIIYAWATQNKSVKGDEGCLVMSFKGQLFLEAYLLLKLGLSSWRVENQFASHRGTGVASRPEQGPFIHDG